MKKILLIMISLFIGVLMVGCNEIVSTSEITTLISTELQNSQTHIQTTEDLTTLKPTTQVPTTLVPTTNLQTTQSYLATEELLIHSSLYGNTNGNANNLGLAVYDNINHLHYYALGSGVYSYNPFTEETELLFFASDAGLVQNLTLSNEYLYFVTTENMYLFSYRFSDGVIDSVYEGEIFYVSKYVDYIYLDMVHPTYELRGLHIYKEDDQEFYTQYSWGANTTNLSGFKIYFSLDNDPKIKISAGNLLGKTTLADLQNEDILEIVELNLFKDDGINRSFGMIARTETGLNFYYFSTDTGLKLIHQVVDGLIHSLNNDGSNIYYMSNLGIYKYNVDDDENKLWLNLETQGYYINIINHWIYYSNIDRTTLYRIHPDTLEIENLNVSQQ